MAGDFNLHLDRDPDADQFAALLADTGLTDVCTELGCDEPNRIDKVLYRSNDAVTITAARVAQRVALLHPRRRRAPLRPRSGRRAAPVHTHLTMLGPDQLDELAAVGAGRRFRMR